jgi:hypothetical protein
MGRMRREPPGTASRSDGSDREEAARRSEGSARSATGGVAEGLLVLLGLALPFEAPLFRLGPLQLTTVELVLYAMLAAWGTGVAVELLRGRASWRARFVRLRGEHGRDGLARAAAVWAVVLLASAAVAPTDRTAALKFSLRSLSGILAFFAARCLARPPRVGRFVLLALVVGALVSAACALVDWVFPGSAPAWAFFREGNFAALGLRRASGVFGYPTMGAMYWEGCLPLLLVIPFAWRGRAEARARRLLAAVAASGILSLAILASATRSALAAAAVGAALLASLGRRSGREVPRVALEALALLVALSAVVLWLGGASSPLGERLRWWHDDRWFGVQYELPATPLAVSTGEELGVPVILHNTGTIEWQRDGPLPTHLSYHWFLQPAGGGPPRLIVFDGERTLLPDDVAPGEAVPVVAGVRAPAAPGMYRLSLDLVQEHVTWFSERGNHPGEQLIDVHGAGAEPLGEMPLPAAGAPPISRASLWRVALTLWRQRPLLGIGPDNFRRRYEALLPPPSPGAAYTDTRIHANSLYFETLADLGLVGLAALAGLAVALLRALRRHWVSGCVVGLGCAVAAVTFFVHGLLDYFFEFTPLYGLFWVTLGLTAAFERGSAGSRAPPGSTR